MSQINQTGENTGGYLVPRNYLADIYYAMGNLEAWWELVKDDLYQRADEYQGKMQYRYAPKTRYRWGRLHWLWMIHNWIKTKIRIFIYRRR